MSRNVVQVEKKQKQEKQTNPRTENARPTYSINNENTAGSQHLANYSILYGILYNY